MDAVQLELDLGLEEPISVPTALGIPHPCTPEGIETDRNRVALLDALYEEDGRGSSDHPLHGTYTGLYKAFCTRIGRIVVDQIVEDVIVLLGP
ncbi:MAG: hypothetical protein ACO4CP_12585 [Steroidobacteraceae bacterium]